MASSQTVSSAKPWSLNDREVGFNLENPPSKKGKTADPVWKVYIPKLMPMIQMGVPKETRTSLDSSIFCNASSCKPSIQSTIETQNYLNCNRPPNRAFKYAYKPHGMQMEIELPHCNPDEIRIDNTVDFSEPTP